MELNSKGVCGFCECDQRNQARRSQPPQPARESYAEAREKFRLQCSKRGDFVAWRMITDVLENTGALDGLSLATELQQLCQLRVNKAALDKGKNLEGKL